MKQTKEDRIKKHLEAKKEVSKLWGKPIPGLEVNDIEYQKLKDSFEHWSVGFQRKLFVQGLPGLISRYEEVVHNVKTQTCPHTRDGSLNTGEEYFSCCGISYEYWNDISSRHAIHVIIQAINNDSKQKIENQIQKIDNELKDLILMNNDNKDPIFDPRKEWWKEYLPYGVRP